jgi:Ca2+-binding EF-hand superfamily protein
MKNAFLAVDDWNYGWVDKSNLKRFLRKMEHVATKSELVAILRRYDMDGDAKINFNEFQLGLKSNLTTYGGKCNKVRK